ncbi:MAG: FG-GAP-like repeat-containing protein [Acidobacteriia bacterium]|nr:FG-GAP-like repeat-containing protein [Terriglobia bacterium]
MKALQLAVGFTLFATALLSAQTSRVPLVDQPAVPASVAPGGRSFTLKVNGVGFASGAFITWNGHPLSTIFVDSHHLQTTITPPLIQDPSTALVGAVNPGNRFSNNVFLQVINPSPLNGVPSISSYSAGVQLQRIVVGDFNNDGRMDIVASDSNLGGISVLLGAGDGTFPAAVHYLAGASAFGIVAGDFNGDKRVDIAVTNSGTQNSVNLLLGKGDGSFRAATPFPVGSNPVAIAAVDLNNDGKLDLVTCNHNGGNISVLLGNGDGTFQPEAEIDAGTSPSSVLAADFNGDGRIDLAVSNQGSNDVSILYGNADGTFRKPVQVPVGTAPLWIAAADLNGDGLVDLITANSGSSNLSILIGNQNGTFQPPTAVNTLQNPESLAVGDLNGDGKVDLAVADATKISILLGMGDGTFARRADYDGKRYLGLAAGDFNADGRLDLATVSGTTAVDVSLQTTVALSPVSLAFGGQKVGTDSPTRTVALRNLATTTLNVSDISIVGTNAEDFSQSNDCGTQVDARGSCQITVVFTPTATGVRSATIQISDDAIGGVQIIVLTGTGI